MANIGIIGAGTWGTALGLVLYGNGHSVTLWSAFEEDAGYLDKKREHKNLPGVKLPGDMVFTASMEHEGSSPAEVLSRLHSNPSQSLAYASASHRYIRSPHRLQRTAKS